MQTPILTALFLLLSAPFTLADALSCRFTVECFETEACSETDYSFSVTYQPKRLAPNGYVSKATIVDVSTATTGMFARTGENRTVISGDSNIGTQTKTMIAADRSARHIIMEGSAPMVITYHGTCEETK